MGSLNRSGTRSFARSLYTRHHSRRFRWLRDRIAALQREKDSISVLELGCNEARTLEYMPLKVHRYVGLDAGFQSGNIDGRPQGLELARQRYGYVANYTLLLSEQPEDVARLPEKFDIGVCMETWEYIEPSNVESYVAALADKVEGCLFSTMPNEKGLPLLFKFVGSKVSGVQRSPYTFGQFVNAFCGRMDRVPRIFRGRRGFDYSAMARLVGQYFRYVHLEGVGFPHLPLGLNLNIGMIASHKPIL